MRNSLLSRLFESITLSAMRLLVSMLIPLLLFVMFITGIISMTIPLMYALLVMSPYFYMIPSRTYAQLTPIRSLGVTSCSQLYHSASLILPLHGREDPTTAQIFSLSHRMGRSEVTMNGLSRYRMEVLRVDTSQRGFCKNTRLWGGSLVKE